MIEFNSYHQYITKHHDYDGYLTDVTSRYTNLTEREKTAFIKNEPMLFSCDADFAYKNGGPLTIEFLDQLAESQQTPLDNLIIDSRSHMLMPNWYPCIPGWHLDDVDRSVRADGQPDHVNPSYKPQHFMRIIGDCSRTSFLCGSISLPDVPDGQLNTETVCPESSIYEYWHKLIEEKVKTRRALEVPVQEGSIIVFDWQSFHKGNPATKNGWRWFIRASAKSKRPIVNEIRKQTQVYLAAPFEGW